MGNSFQEKIYLKVSAEVFILNGINIKSEMIMSIYYQVVHLGFHKVDFLVEDIMLAKLKALSVLEDVYYNQIPNYKVVYKMTVSLLINF